MRTNIPAPIGPKCLTWATTDRGHAVTGETRKLLHGATPLTASAVRRLPPTLRDAILAEAAQTMVWAYENDPNLKGFEAFD